MNDKRIFPRTAVPQLQLPMTDGSRFDLREALDEAENFHILLFYRGWHCPVCQQQLKAWDKKMNEFKSLGVGVTAVSSDTEERARQTVEEWGLENIPVAYGLPLNVAKEAWGLYVSKAIKEKEADYFSEPGLYIIRPNGMLFASNIQTMPFARPPLEEVLNAIRFALKNDYPGRGEVREVPVSVSNE